MHNKFRDSKRTMELWMYNNILNLQPTSRSTTEIPIHNTKHCNKTPSSKDATIQIFLEKLNECPNITHITNWAKWIKLKQTSVPANGKGSDWIRVE